MEDDDAHTKRPGGLTALAIINLIFGGLGVISVVGFLVTGLFAETMHDALDELTAAVADPKVREEMERGMAPARNFITALQDPVKLATVMVLSATATALVIVSGIGYLRQRRVSGRWMGNAYAIVGIAYASYETTLLGMGFGIANLLSFLYPVATLWLVNSVFRDDLVN